jgi:predicted Zn-dependent protease
VNELIRVVTLDEWDQKNVDKLCRALYAAFGVGCENAGSVPWPSDVGELADARKLLERVQSVRSYADDKLLYLTSKKLKDRELPSGTAPTHGYAIYGGDRALVTSYGIKNLQDGFKRVARNSLHQLGHLWDLHHCLDPRCSMYPPWTPSFVNGEVIFCNFCREKSEQKIRLAKS